MITIETEKNVRRYLKKFIKRLEKKGYITGKVDKANHGKVRLLTNDDFSEKMIVFKSVNGLEIQLKIQMLGMAIDPGAYTANLYNDVKESIKIYKQELKNKEAAHVDTKSNT